MDNFVAPVMLLFGVLMAGWTCFDLYQARTSTKWPAVQGEIVRSAIHVPAARTRRARWYWHVHYRYTVAAQEYMGWRVQFGVEVPVRVARDMVGRFPVRSAVTVYYHPSRPGRSVLLPGVNKYTRRGFAIAPICWAMAWVFWTGLR